MNFSSYQHHFESILNSENPPAPYDNPDYFNYAKLNWSRMSRWLKKGGLTDEIKNTISSISTPQKWIVITEPWCGDAAHIVPFLHLISTLNPLITLDFELRDSAPHRIEDYLTNGGKSIPKLIIQNSEGRDLSTWGPRPEKCQVIYDELKASKADFEQTKIELQKWYNQDEGNEILKELNSLLKQP